MIPVIDFAHVLSGSDFTMHLLGSTAVPAGLPIWAKGKNRTSLFGH